MRLLHTADLHFQNNPETLAEVCRVADAIVTIANQEQPAAIILAGDTLDCYHSHIRIDSDAARAAIQFVTALALVAPVIVVRGTLSHDRNAPYIFRHLRTRNPVWVSDRPELVSLWSTHDGNPMFFPVGPAGEQIPKECNCNQCLAVFTLVPSLDKTYLEAESIRAGNRDYRELFHDLCAGFGQVNTTITLPPRIFVGHGMVTGATFSSGQQAIGEDMEMSLDALRAVGCDYVALGHVHRFQSFLGGIVYSGSPGRLNFGEPEEKGVVIAEVENGRLPEVRFVPTPARRFVFVECEHGGWMPAIDAEGDLSGAHVRVRFTVPEERRSEVNRSAIEAYAAARGAAVVKVECQVIPAQRQRAAGISQIPTLQEKVKRWASVSSPDELPARVLSIAEVIESKDVDDLLKEVVA